MGSEMCIRDSTHHVYRINTQFDKVLENAKSVIATNRAQVHWKYIVFEHNKHQVEDAREIAKQAGFTTFSTVKTSRCLLYTSDAADDTPCVDLGGRRIIKKKKQPTTP